MFNEIDTGIKVCNSEYDENEVSWESKKKRMKVNLSTRAKIEEELNEFLDY